jgi:crotonobetainyl-CoA:carnitine CoA-transferase CaiB-like acyl-CoA transferase
MSITGEPDGAPVRAGVAVVDILAGLYVALGITAALRERGDTGPGQRVDLSLLEVELASLVNVANNYLIAGVRPSRLGNAHPSIAPYEVVASSDGHVAIAVATEQQWDRFCVAIGRPELRADPRAATNRDRVANRAWLTAELAAVIGNRTTDEWVEALRAADLPCGPVNTIDRILDDPHVTGLDLITGFVRGEHTIQVVGSPLRFSGSPRRAPVPPPRLGEHTDSILGELLGLEPDTIRDLHDAQVV